MTGRFRKLSRLAPILLMAAFLLGVTRPAHAGCFVTLADCYARAAGQPTYWQSVLASADCELEFVGCVRIALIGR